MYVDLVPALAVLVGVTVSVFLAILVGKLVARVFFDASGRRIDEDEIGPAAPQRR